MWTFRNEKLMEAKKDDSFYAKIHLVYIFVKMWVGPLLAKPEWK